YPVKKNIEDGIESLLNIYLLLFPEQGNLKSLKRSLNSDGSILAALHIKYFLPYSVVDYKPQYSQLLTIVFLADHLNEIKVSKVSVEDGIVIIRQFFECFHPHKNIILHLPYRRFNRLYCLSQFIPKHIGLVQ